MPTPARMRSLARGREWTAHFSGRKSPFVQCFVLDWRYYGLGRGGKRDPKHCTKAFRSAGTTAPRGTGWPRMVVGAVCAVCVTTRLASPQVQHRDLGLFL